MTTWKSTTTQHLVLNETSGTYYVRIKVRGQIVRQSLKTKSISVAKAILPDKLKEIRYCLNSAPTTDVQTMGDCLDLVLDAARHKSGLREKSRDYRAFTINRILHTWPELPDLRPRDVHARDCESWFKSVSGQYSPALANNMLGSVRMAFDFSKRAGLLFTDPTADIKRVRARAKNLILPDKETFKKFVAAMRNPPSVKKSWKSGAGADLVEFLAYTGARLNEARNVMWADIDMGRDRLILRETKGGVQRWIPVIPVLKELLQRLPKKGERVLRVGEAEKAMSNAAAAIGMGRITHHDLRHLFATTCIESGVDIPTVASWLGHKDGGVLALKTYGHLRESHSVKAAQRVQF
jgi:integrase